MLRKTVDNHLSNKVWDPGVHSVVCVNNSPIKVPTRFMPQIIISANGEYDASMKDAEQNEVSRTEFDSHANMPLVGCEAYVIADTGKKATVYPYSPDYSPKELAIVDAGLMYECPYSGESYILIVRNAIRVPSMVHNLVPPFILREAGVQVKEIPKFQCKDPDVNDHAIVFDESGFRIPLALRGIFSFFPTSKPSTDDMLSNDNIYLITPSYWNPHSETYAQIEESFLDCDGELVSPEHQQRILMQEVRDDDRKNPVVGTIEVNGLNDFCSALHLDAEELKLKPSYPEIYPACNEIGSVLSRIDPLLNDINLCHTLKTKAQLAAVQVQVGSAALKTDHPTIYDEEDDTSSTSSGEASDGGDDDGSEQQPDDDEQEEMAIGNLVQQVQDGIFDIDSIMASEIYPLGNSGEEYTIGSTESKKGKFKSRRNNPHKYTITKTWSVVAPHATSFLKPNKDGPKWEDVTRRITTSLMDNRVIENLDVPKSNLGNFTKPLPEGIVGTKTTFQFKCASTRAIGAAHARRVQGVSAEHLSKVWRISMDEAQRTLDVTSQGQVHTNDPKIAKNYGTNDRMLRYKHIKEYFFMDTLIATSKGGESTRGNTCCQLFVTDKGYLYVVPMKKRADVLLAVKKFMKEVGVPDAIICDGAGEHTSNDMRQLCNDAGTTLRILERGTPWANKAELYIGIIKEAVRKDMRESNSPMPLWDYCMERRVKINNFTAKPRFNLEGVNAHTQLTSEEGDISNLAQYSWYEWVYYRETSNKFPHGQELLGRVLGPAKDSGNEMAQWILTATGRIVPRRTIRPLNVSEKHSPIEIKKREIFDRVITKKYGTATASPSKARAELEEWEEWSDNENPAIKVPEIEDSVDANGRLLNQQPAYDKMLHAEVQMQLDDGIQTGRVVRRSVDPEGRITGKYDDNPILNSLVYEVEFTG